MSTTITETHMASDETPHTARHLGEQLWELSWLPGRVLRRDQALTGMVLAETVATRFPLSADDRMWWHVEAWAGELDLAVTDALTRLGSP